MSGLKNKRDTFDTEGPIQEHHNVKAEHVGVGWGGSACLSGEVGGGEHMRLEMN